MAPPLACRVSGSLIQTQARSQRPNVATSSRPPAHDRSRRPRRSIHLCNIDAVGRGLSEMPPEIPSHSGGSGSAATALRNFYTRQHGCFVAFSKQLLARGRRRPLNPHLRGLGGRWPRRIAIHAGARHARNWAIRVKISANTVRETMSQPIGGRPADRYEIYLRIRQVIREKALLASGTALITLYPFHSCLLVAFLWWQQVPLPEGLSADRGETLPSGSACWSHSPQFGIDLRDARAAQRLDEFLRGHLAVVCALVQRGSNYPRKGSVPACDFAGSPW
jgi:hypothetical protein